MTTPSGNDGDASARRLLHLLRSNFREQNKTTCRDCLRTKTLPCPRVVEIANEEVSLTTIETAHQILVNTNFVEEPASSLECMDQISVPLRFLQLLFLLSTREHLNIFNEAQVNQMMASLLKAWTQRVYDWIRICTQHAIAINEEGNCLTADASLSLAPGPVFCFAFYSLLRMNEYVQTRGAVMVPLWKGICELSKQVAPSEDDDADWRRGLPHNILGDAIKVLGDFLQEGRGRLEFEALQCCSRKEENDKSALDRIAFSGKLVGFMVTRMSQLLKIYGAVRKEDPVPNQVWRSLLGLRGLAATLQLLFAADLLGSSNKIDVDFLRVYCEIAAKAGKCVTDTILQKDQKLRKSALESLLCVSLVSKETDDNGKYLQEYPKEIKSKMVRISLLASAMGKVSVLQQILEIANSYTIAENLEPFLATIENLHSLSVPQCLSACLVSVRRSKSQHSNSTTTTPTTIVLESLRVMIRTLRKIQESSMSSSKRDSFYRLLIRWLVGKIENREQTNKGVATFPQEHPLSRELIISLIHAHIVGCSDKVCKEGTGPKKLLSYLTKLLMYPRTSTNLRRNIGAVLLRLQTPSVSRGSSVACTMATNLIDEEFTSWLKQSAARQKLSKKRKRNGENSAASRFSQQDTMIISRVLSARRERSEGSFSSSAPQEYRRVLKQEFSRLSSDCSEESSKSEKLLLASAQRNSLLLAWLEGCVATKTDSAFETISDITGLDLLVDIVRPILAAVSSLRFKLGENGDSSKVLKKKVILHCAVMQLSVAWIIAFGDHGKLPIDRVCQLVKNSISKDPWRQQDIDVTSLSLVEDQHSILKFEVVRLLGSVGKAIPSNCSERILKTIRRAFISCFNSSSNWAISSLGISSVMLFASELNASHQQMLPHCLPQARMAFLQARTIGEVTEEDCIHEIMDRITRQLDPRVAEGFTIGNILPCVSTTSIAPGSYILEMPTQEDRTATVIFPPGSKSLEDIQYMLGGMGDEAQLTTQLVKRAVVTPGGVFKLLLVPT